MQRLYLTKLIFAYLKSGEIEIARVLEVVEVVENKATEITLEEGQKRDGSARLGDFFY